MKRNNWKKLFTYGMTAVLTAQLSGILIFAQENTTVKELKAVGVVTAVDDVTQEKKLDDAVDIAWVNTAEITNEDTYTYEMLDDTYNTEEKKEVKPVSATTKKETKSSKDSEVNYSQADLRLLSSLIYCEANGEPYAGKLAVGIVVMNRKRSSKFPDTVKEVVEQPYQFGPVRNGSLNRALSRYDSGNFDSEVDKDCIKAAKEALSGVKTVTYKGNKKDFSSFLYFNGSVSSARYQIANHQFK